MKFILQKSLVRLGIILVLLLFQNVNLFSCISEYKPEHKPTAEPEQMIPFQWMVSENKLLERLETLKAGLETDSTGHNENDYAATLIRLKRFAEAISILRKLDQKFPGNEFILCNLGTVYDFSGKPDSAIYYFDKVVKLSSTPQKETLHLELLKARIAGENGTGYLMEHPPFGIPANTYRKTPKSSKAWFRTKVLSVFVEDMIREQASFYFPPDPCLAFYLSQLGMVVGVEYSEKKAFVLLKLAELYAGKDPLLLSDIQRAIEKLQIPADQQPDLVAFFPPDSTRKNSDSTAGMYNSSNQTGPVEKQSEGNAVKFLLAGLGILLLIAAAFYLSKGRKS